MLVKKKELQSTSYWKCVLKFVTLSSKQLPHAVGCFDLYSCAAKLNLFSKSVLKKRKESILFYTLPSPHSRRAYFLLAVWGLPNQVPNLSVYMALCCFPFLICLCPLNFFGDFFKDDIVFINSSFLSDTSSLFILEKFISSYKNMAERIE